MPMNQPVSRDAYEPTSYFISHYKNPKKTNPDFMPGPCQVLGVFFLVFCLPGEDAFEQHFTSGRQGGVQIVGMVGLVGSHRIHVYMVYLPTFTIKIN